MGDAVTCARGITDAMLTDDTRRAALEELTDWTLAADQTLAF